MHGGGGGGDRRFRFAAYACLAIGGATCGLLCPVVGVEGAR